MLVGFHLIVKDKDIVLIHKAQAFQSIANPTLARNGRLVFYQTMKKRYCSECVFFKFEDSEGLGWCELLEEACVEFEENKRNEYDYD